MKAKAAEFLMSTTAMRRVTWLLMGALLLVYGGWIAYVIAADRPLDANVYLIAAEIIARGGDPYTITTAQWDATAGQMGITNFVRPYRYPPHTALLLLPLLGLPPRGAALIWVTASALGMVAGAWFLARLFPQPYSRPLALLLLLLLVPPLTTLLAGQVNGLLYLCTALGLVWLAAEQRLRAGLMLAAGALLKVLPLALILYLFWRKQWRTGLIAMAMLLLLILLAIPLTGWDGMVSYFRLGVLLGEPGTISPEPTNQTFTAFLGRTFTGVEASQLLMLGRLLSLAMVAATAALCLPIGDFQEYLIREYALIVTALHMIAPFTWYHQLVMLHLPLFVVAMLMVAKRQVGRLIGLFAIVALVDIHGLFWHQITAVIDNGWWMSSPLLLMLCLWGYLAVDVAAGKVAWRRRHRDAQDVRQF